MVLYTPVSKIPPSARVVLVTPSLPPLGLSSPSSTLPPSTIPHHSSFPSRPHLPLSSVYTTSFVVVQHGYPRALLQHSAALFSFIKHHSSPF